jgi:hypothetical protein
LPISVRAFAAGEPARDPVSQRFQQREHIIDPPDRPFVLALRTLLLADDEIIFHRMIGKYLPVFRHEAEPGI